MTDTTTTTHPQQAERAWEMFTDGSYSLDEISELFGGIGIEAVRGLLRDYTRYTETHPLRHEYPDLADRATAARLAYQMRMDGAWEIAEIARAWGTTELVVHELMAWHVRYDR